MSNAVAPLPSEPGVKDEPIPPIVDDALTGLALAAASANIMMQLARLPVGHGVAHSKVDSGRVDLHPVKRARTTLSYIAIALIGGADERLAFRAEVDKQHRQVRSSAPVKYNAFDRELQLWVAACLYLGTEMVYEMLHGPLDEQAKDVLYQHGARFGTTLQMSRDQWPADRAAFEKYWNDGLDKIETDETTRAYLLNLAQFGFLPGPFRRTLGPLGLFLTTGFLPQRFRDEFGLRWDGLSQRRFDNFIRVSAKVNRAMPRALRQFPFNLYLWDTRRRFRTGKPIV
ncbi:oxygenase MpaB family protein [Actinocorallia longicatena]